MKYDFYQTVEESKIDSRPDSPSISRMDDSFISRDPSQTAKNPYQNKKRVNFKGNYREDFLDPNPQQISMSPKIVRKIHAFRGELISRLKKAVETFEIIDNTYQEIIQVGALK